MNWKANPTNLAEAQGLFDFYLAEISKYQNIQLVVCPPLVYLEELAKQLQGPSLYYKDGPCSLGAQDIFWEKSGPYTGEVSVDMLKEFGVTHVLVGHSDRRYKIGETDEAINKKIKTALVANITPALFVGEQSRSDDRKQILETQLTADLADLTVEQVSKVLITYEPVWAISTTPGSEPDSPENTLAALEIIREFLMRNLQFYPKESLRDPTGQAISIFQLLYGGSINYKNVADFLKYPEISGAVIGGASLRKEEFANILKAVSDS